MKIIIDSGHGGSDPGAVAFGTSEKTLNIAFSRLIAEKLEQLGFDVDKSLIEDKYYSNTELTNLIKSSGASLCISCHNNAFNGKARGLEVIHSIHSSGLLAKNMVEEVRKTSFPVRKAYSRKSTSNPDNDYYFLIRLTYPKVETLIIEFGFMDNIDDFKMLNTAEWQDKLTSAVAAAVRKHIPPEDTSKTPIPGNSILTPYQIKTALKDRNSALDDSIVDVYFNIAAIYGLKPDLAVMQAIHETNWFKFTGVVKPEQNNFAGLGATGGTNPGESFPTVEAGVEAHIQHLYAYSTIAAIPSGRALYDTRFNLVKRGIAPNWEDLNGRWAVPGIGYGENIISLQKWIAQKYSVQNPPTLSHWAKPCNDELLKAGLILNDHTKTLDEPASEGMVLCLVNRLRKELMKND